MSVTVHTSIETLDPKKLVLFLEKFKTHKHGDVNFQYIVNAPIWTIDNFLTSDECDEIIKNAERAKFDDINYDNRQRLLSFDKNGILLKTIQTRIDDDILNNLNKHNWAEPYGFTHNIEWYENTSDINECIRIGKHKNGFKWHRDAQYTKSPLLRSNYTILIYLNDCTGGETIFRIPKIQPKHIGITIADEIEHMNNTGFKTISIKPEKGKIVLFDQRLIHCSRSSTDEKYVLRTDLLCSGEYSTDKQLTPQIYLKTEELTKEIFRYAQCMELTDPENPDIDEFYERCISLRQAPYTIIQSPSSLRQLFKSVKSDKIITPNLKFVKSQASYTSYTYTTCVNRIELIKIAILHSFFNMAGKHTDVNFEEFMKRQGVDINLETTSKPKSYEKSIKSHKFGEYSKTFTSKINALPDINNVDIDMAVDKQALTCELTFEIQDNRAVLEVCSFDCDYEPATDEDEAEENKFCFKKFKHIQFKMNDIAMYIIPRYVSGTKLNGNAQITAPSITFNHASCQCSVYYESTGKPYDILAHVTYDYRFDMDDHNISIQTIPKIVV